MVNIYNAHFIFPLVPANNEEWHVISGMIRFKDNSDADNAILHFDSTSSSVSFLGNSSAGNAKLSFTKGADALFNDNSSAGNAKLSFDESSGAIFDGSSSAGSAIINSDGQITFKVQADAENATLMGSGTFDFSGTSGKEGDKVVHAGLIEGGGRLNLAITILLLVMSKVILTFLALSRAVVH